MDWDLGWVVNKVLESSNSQYITRIESCLAAANPNRYHARERARPPCSRLESPTSRQCSIEKANNNSADRCSPCRHQTASDV